MNNAFKSVLAFSLLAASACHREIRMERVDDRTDLHTIALKRKIGHTTAGSILVECGAMPVMRIEIPEAKGMSRILTTFPHHTIDRRAETSPDPVSTGREAANEAVTDIRLATLSGEKITTKKTRFNFQKVCSADGYPKRKGIMDRFFAAISGARHRHGLIIK